jgi:hypothetical protein
MREAVIGLGGVLLGAAVTAGITWWMRRDRQREMRRIAARLLLGEASALCLQLKDSRKHHRVLPDAGERARRLLAAWRERPAELSALPIETWESVTMGVHGLYMLAQEADFLSDKEWAPSTDEVYQQLEQMLGFVEDGIRDLARDSQARRKVSSTQRAVDRSRLTDY